jgi:hypothetical protein
LYCVEDVGDGAFVLYDIILQSSIAGLQLTLLDQQSLLILATGVHLLLELFQLDLYLDV